MDDLFRSDEKRKAFEEFRKLLAENVEAALRELKAAGCSRDEALQALVDSREFNREEAELVLQISSSWLGPRGSRIEHMRVALVDALMLLSADPELQLSTMWEEVSKANALTSRYAESYAYLDELVAEGPISDLARSCLDEIDKRTAAIAADQDLLTDKAIGEAPEWAELREAAETALRHLGEAD